MAPYSAPGVMTRPYTRWSWSHAGSPALISVVCRVSPLTESWRVPSSGWPESRLRRRGLSTQCRWCWKG